MRGSRNFRQGGPGQSDKKSNVFFFFFFFSPQLILQKSNGQFQRSLSFFKVPEGVQHFPGGSNFFQGGLIAYSSAYFTEVKWSISKKSIIFQGSRGGPTFSRGVQLFPGGSNCLFPIETHITFDFPGGSGPPVPPPPLDPHL